MNSVASIAPRTDMLYFPIPLGIAATKHIYALVDIHQGLIDGFTDGPPTVLFGVDSTDPSWIYTILQSSGDRHITYKCDDWNRILQVKDGVHRIPANQARALWEELVGKRGWLVIPNQG